MLHVYFIAPIPNQDLSYKILKGSQREPLPAGMLDKVKRGDEVTWTNEFDKMIVLEFYGQIRGNSRSLRLFDDDDETRSIMLKPRQTVKKTVSQSADEWEKSNDGCFPHGHNIHYYRVRGHNLDQPGPGIIVCPPTGPCG